VDDPRSATLAESLLVLGQYGDRIGAILALETGLESGETLKAFLDRLDTGGLGVNYDPANFLLNGFDPVANLTPLKDRIVHTHAKDARRGAANRAAQEVPLGHGDIDWMQYLGTLSALEYRGWVVIEREAGTNRAADVAAGASFLRRLL
jgi:sugar phosphate isomerase/epimerase